MIMKGEVTVCCDLRGLCCYAVQLFNETRKQCIAVALRIEYRISRPRSRPERVDCPKFSTELRNLAENSNN